MKTLSLLVAALALPAVALAQVTVAPSVAFTSPYVFRGAIFSRGLVVQPTVEVRRGPFTVGAFANLDPNGTASSHTYALNEADLYASVARTFGAATLGLAYTLYTFPASTDDGLAFAPTNELAFSAALDAPLAPSLLVAYDFDGDEDDGDLKGVYAELGITQPATVATLPLTFAAALGVDAGYLLPEGEIEPAFAAVSARTSVPVGRATLTPKLTFQIALADAYRQTFAQPTTLYGGLAIGF